MRGNAGDPRVVNEWSKLEIVIRVMMCDEDVAQAVQRHVGAQQLPRRAVAAVDKIRNVVDQDQRRGIAAACFADSWSTFRAEQNQARLCLLLAEADLRQQRARKRKTAGGA